MDTDYKGKGSGEASPTNLPPLDETGKGTDPAGVIPTAGTSVDVDAIAKLTQLVMSLQSQIQTLTAASTGNQPVKSEIIVEPKVLCKVESSEKQSSMNVASPGASPGNTNTGAGESSIPLVYDPTTQPQNRGVDQNYNISNTITKLTGDNNNMIELQSGGTITHTGAIMFNGKKVRPMATKEVDMRVIANSAGVQIITMTSKDDRTLLSSIITSVGLTWPHTSTIDSSSITLPVFDNSQAHNTTAFVQWQQAIIDECKRLGLQDILLKPLDYLTNEIICSNFRTEDGSVKRTDAIKAAIVRAIYDLAKQLFFLLKGVLVKEPYILSSILTDTKIHEFDKPTLLLEGNVNYLWRCLDENYCRITASAIEDANRAFDVIVYGNGKQKHVTCAATNNLIMDIFNANRHLSYVDKPRSDSALSSLLMNRLPQELWNLVTSVTVNTEKTKSYSELCKLITEHSRTIEERRTLYQERNNLHHVAITPSAQTDAGKHAVTNGSNQKGKQVNTQAAAGIGKKKCNKCGQTTHNTDQHYDCNRCHGSHHPKFCPLDKKQVNTVATAEGQSAQSRATPGAVQQFSTAGTKYYACNVSVTGEGETMVINYTAGNISFNTFRQCVMDTGGAAHIACNEVYLFNIKTLDHPVYVTLPDGKDIKVYKYGSMMITAHLVLNRVLLVPSFRVNIISIALLADRGIHTSFNKKSCQLRLVNADKTLGTILATIERNEGNIYVLSLPTKPYDHNALQRELEKAKADKQLNAAQLATKPKGATYADSKGKIGKKPTTVAVRGPVPNIDAGSKTGPGGPTSNKATTSTSSTTTTAVNSITVNSLQTNTGDSDSDSE
ncbi:MAG: hypothetical protein Q7V63_02400 [Gammaproteobacteria bacterium]|nr:hypothetical protein [Gammaproteobacteria bacterium]